MRRGILFLRRLGWRLIIRKNFKGRCIWGFMAEKKKKDEVKKTKIKTSSRSAYRMGMAALKRLRMRNR